MGKKEDPWRVGEGFKQKSERYSGGRQGCNFAVPKLPGLMKHLQSIQQEEEKWASYKSKY